MKFKSGVLNRPRDIESNGKTLTGDEKVPISFLSDSTGTAMLRE